MILFTWIGAAIKFKEIFWSLLLKSGLFIWPVILRFGLKYHNFACVHKSKVHKIIIESYLNFKVLFSVLWQLLESINMQNILQNYFLALNILIHCAFVWKCDVNFENKLYFTI